VFLEGGNQKVFPSFFFPPMPHMDSKPLKKTASALRPGGLGVPELR